MPILTRNSEIHRKFPFINNGMLTPGTLWNTNVTWFNRVSGVELVVNRRGLVGFDVYMTFTDDVPPGLYEGILELTDGNEIKRMPFGAAYKIPASDLSGSIGFNAQSDNQDKLVGFEIGVEADADGSIEIVVELDVPSAVELAIQEEEKKHGRRRRKGRKRIKPDKRHRDRTEVSHRDFGKKIDGIRRRRKESQLEVLEEHTLLFNGYHMKISPDMLEELIALPEVSHIYPYDIPTIDSTDAVDFMQVTRQYLGLGEINADGIDGTGVRVAVIDSGIYHRHAAFDKYLDATGRVRGWQRPGDNDRYTGDGHPAVLAHGTTVSGAVIGTAPGIQLWNYRVMLNNGLGGTIPGMSVVGALELAVNNGADVVNMSLGVRSTHPYTYYTPIIDTMTRAGIVVVVSAGNDGPGLNTVTAPATAPLAIAVGAATRGGTLSGNQDRLEWYSSRGPTAMTGHIKPDIAVTTNLHVPSIPEHNPANTTPPFDTAANGTSHASPVIAGLAALILQKYPDASVDEVRAHIANNARSMIGPFTPPSQYPDAIARNTVFAMGAGFAQFKQALAGKYYVLASHTVPIGESISAMGERNMTALNFGHVSRSNSNMIPITIYESSIN